jgi:uncharacterized protein YcfJ
MNKHGLGLAALLLCGVASAQDPYVAGDNIKYAWADVLRVDPVYDYSRTPSVHEECDDVDVERYDDRGNNAAGAVVGAIIGGVIGSTVGRGDGRRAATVAGALAGGAIGHGAASADDGYYPGVERRCRTVRDDARERRILGYDVQYRYRGDVYVSRLDYDPGERMRVRVSVEPAD